MQVRLTRVKSTHNLLRTPEVVGDSNSLPLVIGKCFSMTAPSLTTFASIRYVETTPIEEIIQQDDKTYEFRTQNSTYKLELL